MREQTKYLLEILYEVFFYLTQFLHSETQILIGRVEVFLEKGVLKIYRKFTAEHQCQISIQLQSNFIEIALRHGYYPVNFLHIFRPPFPRNTSGWLLLQGSGQSSNKPLRDKCPNTELFLVRIFPHSDWCQVIFTANAQKK